MGLVFLTCNVFRSVCSGKINKDLIRDLQSLIYIVAGKTPSPATPASKQSTRKTKSSMEDYNVSLEDRYLSHCDLDYYISHHNKFSRGLVPLISWQLNFFYRL